MRISELVRGRAMRAIGHRRGVVRKTFFRRFLPVDPVIIEAGAHIGSDTVELAREWPRGHVHAFEPVPDLFLKLLARTSSLANVNCYQVALGPTTTTSEMHLSGGESDGSSSLLAPSGHLREHPRVTFETRIPVSVTTLDSWAQARGVTRADFLWLDLQGSELDVLKSGTSLLASVRVVYAEVSLKPMYDSAPLYPELRGWMEEAGLVVVREELPWPDMGNVVFARSSALPPRPMIGDGS